MTLKPDGDQPPRGVAPLHGVDLEVPRTPAQQKDLLGVLWAVVPVPLTLHLGNHVMTFQQAGALLSTGQHQWGPLEVELFIDHTGSVSIGSGKDPGTGVPLPTKTLLELADTVHTALVTDADLGPLFRALNAVAYQRFGGEDSRDDQDVTRRALEDLLP